MKNLNHADGEIVREAIGTLSFVVKGRGGDDKDVAELLRQWAERRRKDHRRGSQDASGQTAEKAANQHE